jgi:hypothetical protein
MRVFLDHCVPNRVAKQLAHAGNEVPRLTLDAVRI